MTSQLTFKKILLNPLSISIKKNQRRKQVQNKKSISKKKNQQSQSSNHRWNGTSAATIARIKLGFHDIKKNFHLSPQSVG